MLGLWPLADAGAVRWWALVSGGVAAAAALIAPTLLRPANRLWHAFGLLLHRVVGPVVVGAIFFAAVVPTGLLMRLCGKDPLRLRLDAKAGSYWIERRPPGPPPETMAQQF